MDNNIKGVRHPEYEVIFKIDGQLIAGTPCDRKEFIKLFNQLETLIQSDDKKYWVIYDESLPWQIEYKEIFWCIPTSEINFAWSKEKGWGIVGRIILDTDEDDEDIVAAYKESLSKFDSFESSFGWYLLFDKRADEDSFHFWKNMHEWTETPKDTDIQNDNKMCLITYLEHDWNAWLQSILDGEYKYMNLTRTVWESWDNQFQLDESLEFIPVDETEHNGVFVESYNDFIKWFKRGLLKEENFEYYEDLFTDEEIADFWENYADTDDDEIEVIIDEVSGISLFEDDKEDEIPFDFSVEGLMRMIVSNDELLTQMKSDRDSHSRLIDLTMKAYTWILNPLPFDEVGHKNREAHWQECLDYAKKHGLDKPCLTLDDQTVKFFRQIWG